MDIFQDGILIPRQSRLLFTADFKIYFFFFAGVFFATAFSFFSAGFFSFFFLPKALGICASIHFFISSSGISFSSSAVYLVSSAFLGSLMIFFPNFTKGPQRAFSIEIFWSGQF